MAKKTMNRRYEIIVPQKGNKTHSDVYWVWSKNKDSARKIMRKRIKNKRLPNHTEITFLDIQPKSETGCWLESSIKYRSKK